MVAFRMAIGVQGLNVACLLVGLLYLKYNSYNLVFVFPPIFNLRLYHKGKQLQKQKKAQSPMELDNLKRADKIFSVSAEQGQRAVCVLLHAHQNVLSFHTESVLLC